MTAPQNLQNLQFSDEFTRDMKKFMEWVPPRRLHRRVLHMFLMYLQEDAGLPDDFKDTVTDLYFLFEFLDQADKEMRLQGMKGEMEWDRWQRLYALSTGFGFMVTVDKVCNRCQRNPQIH